MALGSSGDHTARKGSCFGPFFNPDTGRSAHQSQTMLRTGDDPVDRLDRPRRTDAVIFTSSLPTPRRSGTIASATALVLVLPTKRNVFVAENPNAPTPGRDPLHDPPEPPARDPPDKPLHDPPGDPTYEPPQPRTDPTPNPASDPPRELPSGVAWC
jgi:hypothetical protein